MKEFFFEKRGIYYRRNEFKSERPTLFFVHGVSGSSSAWLPYESAFESDYNVLSFDLRGHGKSAKFARFDDYEIQKFSGDMHELLEHCGIKKCVLISHSFGAFASLDFIGKHHDMVLSTIFISPHFAIKKMRGGWLARSFLAVAVKVSMLLRWKKYPASFDLSHGKSFITGKHVDYSKYINSGDWNVLRTIADVRNTGLWIFLYSMAQAYDFDGEEILKKIKVPTLVIHGAKDTIIPLGYGIVMAKKIKGSKLVVIDDIDHIIVLNRSEKAIGIVKDFFMEIKL